MSYQRIKAKAHSQSINKIVTSFEDECGMKASGKKPSERIESIIEQVKASLDVDPKLAEELNQLITSAFVIGAQSGFSRALERFQDGKITTKKVKNEDEWVLYSDSKQYQITENLPSMDGTNQNSTVYISLSDNGFE
jgi:hypothetical protein